MSVETVCRAADPTKCRYHTAYRNMQQALKTGDFAAYAQHRAEAETHIHEEERKRFFQKTKPNPAQRTQELNKPENQFHTQYARGPKRRNVTYKSNTSNNQWTISAITDETGAYCIECRKNLSMKSITHTWNGTHVICTHCNRKTFPGVDGCALTQQAVDNLNPETTRSSIWYHASRNPNWVQDLNNNPDQPIIHAGTRLAAWMRAKTLQQENPTEGPFHLYEIRINPDAQISDTLYEDEDYYGDDAPPHPKNINDTRNPGFENNKIMRYINWWEDTGSASIMANPKLFTATNTGTFNLETPYQP